MDISSIMWSIHSLRPQTTLQVERQIFNLYLSLPETINLHDGNSKDEAVLLVHPPWRFVLGTLS